TAHTTVHTRYARCPIASPNPKYSHSATAVSTATATATIVVEPHNTSAITTGISTTAVPTRFHIIARFSFRPVRSVPRDEANQTPPIIQSTHPSPAPCSSPLPG